MFDRLCPALKSVFEHGLKKSSLLGGPGHPWLFIEEVFIFCLLNTLSLFIWNIICNLYLHVDITVKRGI